MRQLAEERFVDAVTAAAKSFDDCCGGTCIVAGFHDLAVIVEAEFGRFERFFEKRLFQRLHLYEPPCLFFQVFAGDEPEEVWVFDFFRFRFGFNAVLIMIYPLFLDAVMPA